VLLVVREHVHDTLHTKLTVGSSGTRGTRSTAGKWRFAAGNGIAGSSDASYPARSKGPSFFRSGCWTKRRADVWGWRQRRALASPGWKNSSGCWPRRVR
jgi:hypothetical protein